MARALLLFTALAASAAAQDATDVLRGIAKYAAGAASWRLTGRTLTSVGMRDSRTTLDLAFRATWERPGRLRYEVLGGPKAGLLVCNGVEGWTLLPGKPGTPLPAGSLCPAAPTNWDTLGDELLDARFDGSGSALVEGRDQPCDRIVAQYSALRGLAPGTPGEMWRGAFRRTLCVDRVRQVILRDEIAGTLTNQRHGPLRFEQTTTYALIERNPQLDDSRFDTGFPFRPLRNRRWFAPCRPPEAPHPNSSTAVNRNTRPKRARRSFRAPRPCQSWWAPTVCRASPAWRAPWATGWI